MDASRDERDGLGGTAGALRDARARAAAYLDLWERHVGLTAVHGLAPRPAPAAASLPADAPGTGA